MEEDNEYFDEDLKSKSAVKRELEAIRKMGARLLELPSDQLNSLSDPDLIAAVQQAQKINKGSARKRQIQYIAKLLRQGHEDEVAALLEKNDSSSREHTLKFHQLERWREQLIADDLDVIDEIAAEYPHLDRQHLRQLTRLAQREAAAEKGPTHFRKLFQYLKSLT